MPSKKILNLLFACVIFFSGCLPATQTNINVEPTYNENRTLLFTRDGQIYAAEPDGKNEINISDNNKENFSPLWVTTGKEVLYISSLNGYYEVRQKNLPTGEENLLWGSKAAPKFINLSQDKAWLVYAEENGCYLFNKEEKKASRISEECSAVSWAFKKKRFVLSAGNKLYLYEFNIKQDLSEPKEIFNSEARAPIFLDDNNIIFEAQDPDANPASLDIHKLSLQDNSLTQITDLNFPSHENVSLQLSPDKQKIAYSFAEETWLIMVESPELAKQVLQNAEELIWNESSDGFYYVSSVVDENNEIGHNIYSATKDGLNKKRIIANASSPAI